MPVWAYLSNWMLDKAAETSLACSLPASVSLASVLSPCTEPEELGCGIFRSTLSVLPVHARRMRLPPTEYAGIMQPRRSMQESSMGHETLHTAAEVNTWSQVLQWRQKSRMCHVRYCLPSASCRQLVQPMPGMLGPPASAC